MLSAEHFLFKLNLPHFPNQPLVLLNCSADKIYVTISTKKQFLLPVLNPCHISVQNKNVYLWSYFIEHSIYMFSVVVFVSLFHINAAYRRRQLLNDVYSMVELAKIQNNIFYSNCAEYMFVCIGLGKEKLSITTTKMLLL